MIFTRTELNSRITDTVLSGYYTPGIRYTHGLLYKINNDDRDINKKYSGRRFWRTKTLAVKIPIRRGLFGSAAILVLPILNAYLGICFHWKILHLQFNNRTVRFYWLHAQPQPVGQNWHNQPIKQIEVIVSVKVDLVWFGKLKNWNGLH